jgi:hypothetical protein
MPKKIRGSLITSDWVFGKGKSDYLRDDAAIAYDIATKLKTFRGECFFDSEVGVRWFSLLGQKDQQLILFELKQVILAVDGITAVTNVEFQLGENRSFMVRYWVNTVNTSGISGSVEL